MNTITLELPSLLQERIELIAQQQGISVNDFLVKSADKMSQIEILNQIKRQAAQRNTLDGFEKVMNAVPDVEPENPDDRIDF